MWGESEHDLSDDEDDNMFYRHKISSIVSGSTQDAIDQCTSLLCKTIAIPTSSTTSFLDYVMGNGNTTTNTKTNQIEELTLKMEDKSFYKIGRYIIKLSSSVDLSVGLNDDFTNDGNKSYGRVPDEIDEERHLDMVIKGKFDAIEASSFNDKSKSFKSRESRGNNSLNPLHHQFVLLPHPQRKFYNNREDFERSKLSFNRKFELMKSIDYYLLSLKCSKIKPPKNENYFDFTKGTLSSFYDAEEINYMNDPMMLTYTLEQRCGQICTSIYAFDLELLVGIRHEIWTTETEIHNLNIIDNTRQGEIDITKDDDDGASVGGYNVDGDDDDKYRVIGDVMSESEKTIAMETLTKKLERLKTAYMISFQQEKNKLYNTISLECFVKRPWIFVFYLPYHCYQAVRGKKDNNGFDFHTMICEISIRMLKVINAIDYFSTGTYGECIYVTFVHCGIDILDEHINGNKKTTLTEITSKGLSMEVYQKKIQKFYMEAKRTLFYNSNNYEETIDRLKKKIVMINNDEMPMFSKKLAYTFYTKDRLQKHPVLTKINIKKIPKK